MTKSVKEKDTREVKCVLEQRTVIYAVGKIFTRCWEGLEVYISACEQAIHAFENMPCHRMGDLPDYAHPQIHLCHGTMLCINGWRRRRINQYVDDRTFLVVSLGSA